jgi:hypothetical protein
MGQTVELKVTVRVTDQAVYEPDDVDHLCASVARFIGERWGDEASVVAL